MAEDEDIYSDVDSDGFVDDMKHYGVAQAFPLDDEGIDADAARYLRTVREEAARIPHVCASAKRRVQPEPQASQASLATRNSFPPPMMEWMQSVVNSFVEAREQVQYEAAHGRARTLNEDQAPVEQSLPAPNDRRGWQQRIADASFQPYAHTLAKMDNNLAASCLCVLADEILNRCVPAAPPGGHGSFPEVPGEELPSHLALWLYGLMVRLEQPVTPDVAAALRQVVLVAEAGLARCSTQRTPPDAATQQTQPSSHGSSTDHADVCMAASAAVEDAPFPGLHPDGARGGDGQAPHASTGAQVSLSAGSEQAEGGAHGRDVSMATAVQLGGEGGERGSGCGDVKEVVARCDTLRVLAGGFFGQDGTLAPLVHDYLISIKAR